jgi:hypothetical protein
MLDVIASSLPAGRVQDGPIIPGARAPRRYRAVMAVTPAPGPVTLGGRVLAEPDGTVTVEPRRHHDQLTTSGTGPIAPATPPHLRLTGLPGATVAALPGARRSGGRLQAWADLAAEILPDGTATVIRCGPLTRLHDLWTPEPHAVLDAGVPAAPAGRPVLRIPPPAAEQHLIDAGVIVSRKVLRTHGGGKVLLVAATDPDAAERVLRPVYGERLRVRQSTWTAAQHRAAAQTVAEHADAWQVLVLGDHVDGHGRVVVTFSTVDTPPPLTAWLAGQPPGLVDHRPWLRR